MSLFIQVTYTLQCLLCPLCSGINITLTDKNGRTVFEVLNQYPTARSEQIKDIIVGTSQTADRQFSAVVGDDSDDAEGISSVNNPVYDSTAGALQQMSDEGLDQDRIYLSDRLNPVPKRVVCAVARVDYQDSSHSEALHLSVGDRIRVIGLNSNGTYLGVVGEKEGSFFASHVDFYQGGWKGEEWEGRSGEGRGWKGRKGKGGKGRGSDRGWRKEGETR